MNKLLEFLNETYPHYGDETGNLVFILDRHNGSIDILVYDPVAGNVYFTTKVIYRNSKGEYIRYRLARQHYRMLYLSEATL